MADSKEFVTVSDSEEEASDSDLPSREECESRCQMFAEVTATDTALAMFYLQSRKWNVEKSISDYFGEHSNSAQEQPHQSNSSTHQGEKKRRVDPGKRKDGKTSEDTDSVLLGPMLLQPEQEGRIRVLSWNIDGLDPDNLVSRTEGACAVLLRERSEVIFLQEVVQRSLSIIKEKLTPLYKDITGDSGLENIPGAYFTVMLIRSDCSTLERARIVDFSGSLMSRNLMEVQCVVKGVPLVLLTAHLESTKEYSAERKKQLKMAFDQMVTSPAERTVIFGGDLNLRDKEVAGDSAKPMGIYDLWEETGKRNEAKFTWDLTINDNKQYGTKFQPRCRFDRLYIRHCRQSGNKKTKSSPQGNGDTSNASKNQSHISSFFSPSNSKSASRIPSGDKTKDDSASDACKRKRSLEEGLSGIDGVTSLGLKPQYFELVGIQRLVSCRRFPSDHWGILAHLDIVKSGE